MKLPLISPLISRCSIASAVVALAAAMAGCSPATTFAQVSMNYVPSANISMQPTRVTGSAIPFGEGDRAQLESVGATYLGELDVAGTRGFLVNGASGATNLEGRSSLAAAARGATHFMLLDSNIDRVRTGTTVIVTRHFVSAVPDSAQRVGARYALLRVDPSRWASLPPTLRPDGDGFIATAAPVDPPASPPPPSAAMARR